MLHLTSNWGENKSHLKYNFIPDQEKWKCLTIPHGNEKAEKDLTILIG